MTMMQTPTASLSMMVVNTIRNGGGADTDSERSGDGGDHYQQWR
jgi:hypothetical protein